MSQKDDPLKAAHDALKRAKRVSSAAEEGTQSPDEAKAKGKAKAAPSREIKTLASVAGGLGGITGKVLGVLDVLWNQWLRPVTRFFKPITDRIWRFYSWSYRKFAHIDAPDRITEDGTPERIFSGKRGAAVTLALIAISIITPLFLIKHALPAMGRTAYDGAMLTTMKEDTLFLSRAELINPDRGVYQVTGCRDIKGCTGGDNTTYYRLRDNIILDIKYWTTRFEPYDPAEIAGAMVSELNDCTIKYYGRRSKALGWYPYIVSASCVPA